MNPRRTRRDTKEEERLKSLLREAGTLEYDGTLERPAWAQVRDRLQTAPRRRNVLVPAACTTAALLVMGYGLWVMGFGRKVQQLKGKEQMMALAPQPTTHNLRPPTQNPKPKTQNLQLNPQPLKPKTQNPKPKTIVHQPLTIVVTARTYAPGGYEVTTTWQGNVQTTVTTNTRTPPPFIIVTAASPPPTPPVERDEGVTVQSASVLPTVIVSGDALRRHTVISAQPLEPTEEKTEVRPLLKPVSS